VVVTGTIDVLDVGAITEVEIVVLVMEVEVGTEV
jgi:hypothetical protein